jgi:hypothetical protein
MPSRLLFIICLLGFLFSLTMFFLVQGDILEDLFIGLSIVFILIIISMLTQESVSDNTEKFKNH